MANELIMRVDFTEPNRQTTLGDLRELVAAADRCELPDDFPVLRFDPQSLDIVGLEVYLDPDLVKD